MSHRIALSRPLSLVAGLLATLGCGPVADAPGSPVFARHDGIDVIHTVCPVGAPQACEFASPKACAIGGTVTAGDICLVLGGEYHETVTFEPGFLKARLVFRCAPGFHCLVDGDGVRASGFDCYDDWVIEGFEVTNTTGAGIDSYRRCAAVRDCYVHDVRGPGIAGVGGTTTSTAFIEGNVVQNTGGDGIQCRAPSDGPIIIRNNLVVDPSLGASGRGISCGDDGLVVHNTVDARNRTLPWSDPAAFGVFGMVVRYNVVAGASTGVAATVARDHNLSWDASSAAFGSGDAGSPVTDLVGDPLFLTAEDWRVAASSPAIDAGVGSLETIDHDGRPRDGLPDLGAWEYDPAHVPAPLAWPTRETPATPAQPSCPHLALRDGPDGGPLLAWLDTTANTAEFRARVAGGAWRGETVKSALGMTSLTAQNLQRRLLSLAVEPATGRPVLLYPQWSGGSLALRLARRLGDACGSGCASPQWTGCADTPALTLTQSGTEVSFKLAFNPATGRPVFVLWRRTPGGCSTTAARDTLTLHEQQASGSWVETPITASTCGTNYLPSSFDFALSPTGEVEVLFSRTTSLSSTSPGELLLATNAGGPFVVSTVPLGAGLTTGHGNSAMVALARRAPGSLLAAFRGVEATVGGLYVSERVAGAWQPPRRLAPLAGLTALSSLDAEWGVDGEPQLVFVTGGALERARRIPERLDADAGVLPERWDVRTIDSRKDTGSFATLAMLPDGGVVVGYQQEAPNKALRLLANVDPGGVAAGAVDPAVCDQCPADPNKTAPGFCGCGYQESPAVSLSDATVSEGGSGTSQLSFTVTLNHACGANVSVNWVTANGTATSGEDYNSSAGTVLFTAGQAAKTVSVTVLGDTTFEGDETVLVNLSGVSSGASVADGQGVGVIVNDDPPPQDAGAGGGGGSGSDAGAGGGGGSADDAGAGGGGGSADDAGAGGGGGGSVNDAGSGGGGGPANDAGAGGGGGSANDAGTGGGGGAANDAGTGGGGGSANDAGTGGGGGSANDAGAGGGGGSANDAGAGGGGGSANDAGTGGGGGAANDAGAGGGGGSVSDAGAGGGGAGGGGGSTSDAGSTGGGGGDDGASARGCACQAGAVDATALLLLLGLLGRTRRRPGSAASLSRR